MSDEETFIDCEFVSIPSHRKFPVRVKADKLSEFRTDVVGLLMSRGFIVDDRVIDYFTRDGYIDPKPLEDMDETLAKIVPFLDGLRGTIMLFGVTPVELPLVDRQEQKLASIYVPNQALLDDLHLIMRMTQRCDRIRAEFVWEQTEGHGEALLMMAKRLDEQYADIEKKLAEVGAHVRDARSMAQRYLIFASMQSALL